MTWTSFFLLTLPVRALGNVKGRKGIIRIQVIYCGFHAKYFPPHHLSRGIGFAFFRAFSARASKWSLLPLPLIRKTFDQNPIKQDISYESA
jgi:hypothetical protein